MARHLKAALFAIPCICHIPLFSVDQRLINKMTVFLPLTAFNEPFEVSFSHCSLYKTNKFHISLICAVTDTHVT